MWYIWRRFSDHIEDRTVDVSSVELVAPDVEVDTEVALPVVVDLLGWRRRIGIGRSCAATYQSETSTFSRRKISFIFITVDKIWGNYHSIWTLLTFYFIFKTLQLVKCMSVYKLSSWKSNMCFFTDFKVAFKTLPDLTSYFTQSYTYRS